MRGAIQLASLLRSQWDSAERLRQRQSAMLCRLVTHACATVPWYRDLFREAGVNPREIRGIDDLGMIPVTTRRDLQEQPPERLISSKADPSRLMSSRTAGWKYIFDQEGPREELYDLENDPGETENLIDDRPEQAEPLRQRVRNHLEMVEGEAARLGDGDSGKAFHEDEEVSRRLADLGYL
jgi:hypothetical protein